MANNENDVVKIGNDENSLECSLLELAGVSLDDIEEKRNTITPAGVFTFIVKEHAFRKQQVTTRDTQETVVRPVVDIICEIIGETVLNDSTLKAGSTIGKLHYESFFISEKEDIGRIKAFIVDTTGQPVSGGLGIALDKLVGTKFNAKITHKADKNDKDKVYARMDMNKLKPAA